MLQASIGEEDPLGSRPDCSRSLEVICTGHSVRSSNGWTHAHRPTFLLGWHFWTAPTGASYGKCLRHRAHGQASTRPFRRWSLAGVREDTQDSPNESKAACPAEDRQDRGSRPRLMPIAPAVSCHALAAVSLRAASRGASAIVVSPERIRLHASIIPAQIFALVTAMDQKLASRLIGTHIRGSMADYPAETVLRTWQDLPRCVTVRGITPLPQSQRRSTRWAAHQRLDEQRAKVRRVSQVLLPATFVTSSWRPSTPLTGGVHQCRRPVLVIAGPRGPKHLCRMRQIGRLPIARARLAAVANHRRRPKRGRRCKVHAVLTRPLRQLRLGLPVLVGTGPRRWPEPRPFCQVPAKRQGSREGARGRPVRSPRRWLGQGSIDFALRA